MKVESPTHSKGQGLTEYALILVLTALVVIVALVLLGPAIGNAYSSVINQFDDGSADETGNEQPGECYSSLLIAIMVGTMATVTLIRYFLPNRPVKAIAPL